ncbi:624_t:CDS:2 [Funneliformis mosseae]|uniref:624_t:CDS:1 n=1 Tax=Funneliformis mosseae TaxID=27381 RepID=A0A9N8ZRH2_FUNMO|nr:624_t:CDS:2 [Funneliformis mosseae]
MKQWSYYIAIKVNSQNQQYQTTNSKFKLNLKSEKITEQNEGQSSRAF